MAIYTPRGLKIRLEKDHAFALMARLYPTVVAFQVLKTTEGFELIPSVLAFIFGLVAFYLGYTPYQIGLSTFIASVLGHAINVLGLFRLPVLPRLGTLISYASGYGVFFLLVVAVGYLSVGYQGVIAFYAGGLLAGFINLAYDYWNIKHTYSTMGIPYTTSEMSFFNAYRLHASKLGRSTEISVTDDERSESNWRNCLADLASKWPEVVQRFTGE